MDLFGNLALGFSVAFQPINLLYGFVGVMLGTIIGVLPGLGPVATISLLLPVTFALQPQAAMIMLAGIYYGAQYGGSTTAILVNLPGESSAVVTCIDGYQMARKGQAGLALAAAALASFFAGTVATFVIALAAPMLAEFALEFGPADYFSLMVFGLVAAVILAHGSVIKAIGMILVGILLGTIGIDVNTSVPRFTFGIPQFGDGIDFAVIAMGIFGIGETIANLGRSAEAREYVKNYQRPVAVAARPRRDGEAGPARHRARLGARHPAGRRADPGVVFRLCAGEEGRQGPEPLRPRRDRGRRRAGGGQQRRRADRVHSAAHARAAVEPGDGADDRRADDARAASRDRNSSATSRSCSGAWSPACGSAT